MIPEIRKVNGKKVLFVHGNPYYAVAGEVHNSDASSPEYMEKIWKTADDLGLNTLLLPVTWELLEPEEGRFDFSVPDAMICQAREWGKKIIFLWFGSWKNAEMMYAPAWVKKDRKRFRRAQIVKGQDKTMRDMGVIQLPYYSLSYLCKETMDADANAFAKLMAHIKAVDGEQTTVIAVQVENETGLLGNAREVSDFADLAFKDQVPETFVNYMKAHTDTMHDDVKAAVESGADSGSWSDVFGNAAEEIFSAYYISRFVNYVAEKGKEEYSLPMLANCWLVHKGDQPGQYPSGGPVSRMHEVWHCCAPAIDVLCPDVYVPEFLEVCDDYTRNNTPLFIPEAAVHSYAAPRLAYCIGHYHAMGYSPFGFDDIGKPFSAMQGFLFGMDVTDPALKIPQDFEEYAWFGKTLSAMMPVVASKYGTDALQATCAEQQNEQNFLSFGKLNILAVFKNLSAERPENGVVMGVKVSDDEIYLIGYNCFIMLLAGDAKNMDILEMEEGNFQNGQWVRGRRLNGDEVTSIMIDKPQLLRVKVHTYSDEL